MRRIEAQQNSARNGGEPSTAPERTLEEICYDAQDRIAANAVAADHDQELERQELETEIRELRERAADDAERLAHESERAAKLERQLGQSELESLELFRENRQYQIAVVALRKKLAEVGG